VEKFVKSSFISKCFEYLMMRINLMMYVQNKLNLMMTQQAEVAVKCIN